MKIKIKLEDPKSCEGCPCFYSGFWKPNKRVCGCTMDYFINLEILRTSKKRRPQRCIDENGE